MPTRRTAAEPVDLRQRILDTSRALLDEEGAGALSMREVARRAGVTHQAPYHHFTDRESILAELVCQGFDQLAQRLAQARERSLGAEAVLTACGAAYVVFALDHPGVFRIMFRQDLCDSGRFPEAVAAGRRAYAELLAMVSAAHGAADDTLAALHWAQVHGLAGLLLDGPLGQQLPGRRERLAFVRDALARHARLSLAA